jgi:putative ABC transport system permease protein
MKILALKSFRDLKAMKLRSVMIILIIACQGAIYAGGLCSKLTLHRSVDDFCDKHNLANLQVTFDVTRASSLPELGDVSGIKKVVSRLMIKGAIHLEDNTMMPAVIIFVRVGENPVIDTLDIEDGAFPTKGNLGVVIERGLVGNGYNVGDTITVSAYGFTSTQSIVGIARSPEFLVSTANPEMLIPTPGSLGIIFAPVECCEKEIKKLSFRIGGTDPVNQLLFLYDDSSHAQGPGTKPSTKDERDAALNKEILARLSGAKTGLRIKSVLRRNEQFGIKFLQQDLKMFRVVVLAIVVVFSIVTLIVTGISVNRVVMSQRREIGALMAFGYRPRALMMSYARLGFLMGLTGGLVGVAVSPFVNYLLAETYASAVSLPPITLAFNPGIMAGGVLIGIVVASVAAVMPVIKLVSQTPVRAMRGGADDALQRVAVLAKASGALTGVLSRSLPQRAAARNLFRRMKLTAATILLIALGLGITAGFVITLSSVLDSSNALLRRNKWDIVADFTEPQSSREGLKLCNKAGLADPELFVKGYASISFGGRLSDYQLVGMPTSSKLSPLRLTGGRGFSGDDANEIIFNASFSEFAPPDAGDTVVIRIRGREYRLTVAGFISSLSTGQAYVPIETARRMLGLKKECSGFMARLNGTGVAEVKERLYASERVNRVTVRSKLESVIDAQLAKVTNLIVLAVIIGAVVTLAIVINTMTMNILEREGEFATLMSLGYGRLPLARMVLTEVFVMGVTALALAVPVAVVIARYMNGELSQVWFHIDMYVTLKDFGLSLLLPFLLLPLAAVPALRHVFRLNIALVVREHVIE